MLLLANMLLLIFYLYFLTLFRSFSYLLILLVFDVSFILSVFARLKSKKIPDLPSFNDSNAGTKRSLPTTNTSANSSVSTLFNYIHTWKSIKSEKCLWLDSGIREGSYFLLYKSYMSSFFTLYPSIKIRWTSPWPRRRKRDQNRRGRSPAPNPDKEATYSYEPSLTCAENGLNDGAQNGLIVKVDHMTTIIKGYSLDYSYFCVDSKIKRLDFLVVSSG
jgi:hypothetical protein